MDAVLDAIGESRCAIEVNGDRRRLDLEPHWIRAARDRGIKYRIHRRACEGWLVKLRYGLAIARRGWLARREVLNTFDVGGHVLEKKDDTAILIWLKQNRRP